MVSNSASKRTSFNFMIFAVAFIAIVFYLIVRVTLFFLTDFYWYEKLMALLLLLAEVFVIVQAVGYYSNVFLVRKHEVNLKLPSAEDLLRDYPPIAIVVASYKEPIPVIRDTLICFYNISYPNKHLYFLDDTRYDLPWDTPENKEKYRQSVEELCQWLKVNLFRSKWHGAKAGKINDFLQFLAGNHQPDFEFHQYETQEKREREKYLLIFDADMNPIPNFAEELVALMEKNPKLAFVQTPQYYTNFETNRVAHAAGIQQVFFFEYICEGKGLKNSMFCCGSNVLIRIDALMEVGGFDENSVTEDFATSLKLHGLGWQSLYVNKVLAFGMGPEDLGGYFKQQFRWATGTMGVLKQLPVVIRKHFRQFSFQQIWEYFLSSTYYFIGWINLIFIICPSFYLIFNIPRYFAYPEFYIGAYIPYMVFTSYLFFSTLMMRKYRASDLIPALLMNATAFPIFIKASIYAMLGIKTSFGITPKVGVNVLSLRSLLPQISTSLLCVFAIVWGLQRIYYERDLAYALSLNIFWCFYHFVTISSFLYFNHAEDDLL